MADSINLIDGVSRQTFEALSLYASNNGYEGFVNVHIQPEWLAWLIALLKAEPDTEDLFPKGKWATVQHLEGVLLESAVRQEIAGRRQP